MQCLSELGLGTALIQALAPTWIDSLFKIHRALFLNPL